jgi:hypothetical protein
LNAAVARHGGGLCVKFGQLLRGKLGIDLSIISHHSATTITFLGNQSHLILYY